MKRIIYSILCILYSALSWALTIPQGVLYFDNSKTKYNAVRFVYGSDQRKETYALAMTQDGNKWRVEIPNTVSNMYRFTFVGSDIKTGEYTQDFNAFKDSISNKLSLYRTATSEAQMNSGDIFVPQTGDNWAQGSWTSLSVWEASQQSSGTAAISGTLPVVYITTTGNAPIDSKEVYVSGTIRIDPLTTGYDALGSTETPVTAQFKGRGNWTWTGFDKKPYRIKLDAKSKVLGMPSNKHWCLMAHADDNMGFLKNFTGYLLSEQIGLKWTPKTVPVELVINGNYQGLYFLTEQVRVSSKRVNVTEQEDMATDSVTGGWLVEIDNYKEDGNVEFDEGNGQHIMVTMKSPEVLSQAQRSYIEGQLYGLNDAIYGKSAAKLWGMLDLDEAVKYYLVQEILEDCESYHGSCYLYKERDRNGKTEKWFFGPVWDFGNTYNRNANTWIYDNPIWPQYWIGRLAQWPDFQAKLKEYWYTFYHSQQSTVLSQIDDFAALIAKAAKNDAAVWNGTSNYCNNSNMLQRGNEFKNRFNGRISWLYSKWGEGTKPSATWNSEVQPTEPSQGTKMIINGQLYIRINNTMYDATGKRIQ